MFDLSASLPPTVLKVQAPASAKIVTGQRLAKASSRYPWWVRAEQAARWLRGEVVVEPTIKNACAVFAISRPRLKKAQARLDRNKHHPFDEKHGNGVGAPALSDDVVERFITAVGVDRIWRVVEKLTQPELPLQAVK